MTLLKVKEEEIKSLIKELLRANTIVVAGAGRVGMASRGFAMRLGHLGFKSFAIGDTTVPAIHKGDLLLVCSGSGETQTILDLVTIAESNRSRIALITGDRKSRMAKLANTIIAIEAPSKTKKIDGFRSIQPMTTLNEQCIQIFFDSIVLLLMAELGESHKTMWRRHSNLE